MKIKNTSNLLKTIISIGLLEIIVGILRILIQSTLSQLLMPVESMFLLVITGQSY